MCKQIFHKGKESNECKRKLLIDKKKCGKNCEAKYGKWTEWTKCTGSCIENLDQSDQSGKSINIEEKIRKRICDKSNKSLCEKEKGEDETQFCENQKLCPLQEYDPSTSGLASKYTFHFGFP